MPAIIITNPRGTHAAWDDGLFDGLVLCVHVIGGDAALTASDRTLLAVSALKRWPANSVVTMVDRILAVEDTVAAGGCRAAKRMLADRDADRHLADALLWPVIFASTLRRLNRDEIDRLIDAVDAAGVDPRTFGLGIGG